MSYSFWRSSTLAPGGACPLTPLATPLYVGSSPGLSKNYVRGLCRQDARCSNRVRPTPKQWLPNGQL